MLWMCCPHELHSLLDVECQATIYFDMISVIHFSCLWKFQIGDTLAFSDMLYSEIG